MPEELTGVEDTPAVEVEPAPSPSGKADASSAHNAQTVSKDTALEPDTLEEMGDTAAHGAWRCGECHDMMQDQWSESRHAQSAKSKLYQAMKKDSGEDSCARCHSPLDSLPDAEAHIVSEGVTCEVCHRMEETTVGRTKPGVLLRGAHDIKYGPFCDANQRYFHKSECRPYFQKSELCGSCHLFYQTTSSGTTIPVYTEYEDWKALGMEKQCQDCHMPGIKGSAAVSERIRESIANHSFLGADADLRGSGLDLNLTVTAKKSTSSAVGTIKNARAGHHLPAGMSGRQLVLRLCGSAENSKETCSETIYERRVENAAGKAVPFYAASRVAADTRLAPKKSRQVRLELEIAAPNELRLDLVDRHLPPEVAQNLGVKTEERLLFSKKLTRSSPSQSSWTVRLGK